MCSEEWKAARLGVKKRLSEYRLLKAEHAQIVEELERLEAAMTAPRASRITGMPRGGGGADQMAAKVEQHIALEEKYHALLEALAAAQLHVEEMIESLDPVERKLLRHRYVEGLSWEGVCVAMSYSWRQTHNIHARALDRLVEMEGEG